ncbi:MAG: hypothetical protein ABR968_13130 [Bacteroidales bacterium]|jgi:hypothetical protein
MVIAIPLVGRSQDENKTKVPTITYTIIDVKQNYTLPQVITGYSGVTTTPVNQVLFLNVYTTAWAKLANEAYRLKSDVVIGLHVGFINGTNELKIVLYSTTVKYKP